MGAGIAQWIRLCLPSFHPAAPGSNPSTTSMFFWGAAVAQWIHLRLPSCRPRFESQTHHQCFFQFKNLNLNCNMLKRRNKTEKEAGIGPFFKKHLCFFNLVSNCIVNLSLYCEKNENKQKEFGVGLF